MIGGVVVVVSYRCGDDGCCATLACIFGFISTYSLILLVLLIIEITY